MKNNCQLKFCLLLSNTGKYTVIRLVLPRYKPSVRQWTVCLLDLLYRAFTRIEKNLLLFRNVGLAPSLPIVFIPGKSPEYIC